MTLPFTFVPDDPQLVDVLNAQKKDILMTMNVHHIGAIQSFDAQKQTCVATINYPKTYFQLNASTGNFDPVLQNYPLVVDAPAIVLGGGGGALTFPIAKGDECLVLFNDRDLDNWFQSGAGAQVNTTRLHSFSDAIVLVGLRSLSNVISNYDTTRSVLRGPGGGHAYVGVGSSLIKLANNTTTLNTLLQSLITDLTTLTTALVTLTTAMSSATPGTVETNIAVPSAAAMTAITAVMAQITALGLQIGGLLE